MRIRFRPTALMALVVLAAIGVSFGVAQASIRDSFGVIRACYNLHGGRLRVIGSGQSCRRDEKGISWPSTVGAGVAGWQLIQCTVSTDMEQNVIVSGSPLCSGSGSNATILCPSGKVAMQEAGSLLSLNSLGNGTYVTVLPDGSGAVFSTDSQSAPDHSIQLVCADGST